MKKTILKKLISTLMGIVLVICMIPTATAESGTADAENEDLFINKDVARYIAGFFVRDMVGSGISKWDSDTDIQDIVAMYDETGNNITAYTAELSEGYVVVSAYVDVPNVVLEWADEGEPVYTEFDESPGKVIYTGAMSYFLDTGDTTLQMLDGARIDRREISNQIANLRSAENISPDIVKTISDRDEISSVQPYAYGDENDRDGYITNAGTYAQNVYGGTWTCTGWNNNWESSANYAVTSAFTEDNNCGPVAITNAIKMYGKQYKDSSIRSSTNKSIYLKVLQANKEANGKYYSTEKGTPSDTADSFIRAAFKKCGVSVDTYGKYQCNMYNIGNATTSDRLMYICLEGEVSGYTYVDHAVIGFAWSCMTRSDNGQNKYFVKITDGINSSGRYLDQSIINNALYWEIKFK